MTKVMIAEDDLLTADMLRDALVENGYDVCGIARTVDKAVELAEHCKPDLAILDIRLADGGTGTDIPPRLKNSRHMGVLYASGHVDKLGLTKADGDALLVKPYRAEDAIRALRIVEQIVGTEAASRRFPRGFSVLDASPKGAARPDKADIEIARENKRLRQQQAQLAKFGSFALGEHDLGSVLMEAARVCTQCLEVFHCAIYRYRHEENELILDAGVGWDQGVVGRVVSRADDTTPHGRALIGRVPVTCGDLRKDTTFVQPAIYSDHHIISTLDVIIGNDHQPYRLPYGVLEIGSTSKYSFDSHDIDFLTGIANIIAGAYDASRRAAALQVALNRMQELVDDKNLFLARNNALLEEKNRLLDENAGWMRDIRHRVRNDFQMVYEALSDQLRATTDPTAVRAIGVSARRVMTLVEVYDHLLGAELGRTIELGKYLSSLCCSFEVLEKSRQPNIEIIYHFEPVVCDVDNVAALGIVIAELMANSYAHAFPDGTGSIRVSLSLDQESNIVTIIFSDDGVGFDETTNGKRHGLALVRRLIEQIGGSATLRSDHGATWTLKFPVPISPSVDTSVPTP